MAGPGGLPATGTVAVKKAYGLTFYGVLQSTAKAGSGQGLLGHVGSPGVKWHCGEPTYAEPGRVASATPAVYEFPDQIRESDPCTSVGMAVLIISVRGGQMNPEKRCYLLRCCLLRVGFIILFCAVVGNDQIPGVLESVDWIAVEILLTDINVHV